MTLSVSLHDVTKATWFEFESEGAMAGKVTFFDDKGQQVSLYTSSRVAQALAGAFNAASAADEAVNDAAYAAVHYGAECASHCDADVRDLEVGA